MTIKFVDFFHLFDTKLCWSTHNTTHSNAVIFSFSSFFWQFSVSQRLFSSSSLLLSFKYVFVLIHMKMTHKRERQLFYGRDRTRQPYTHRVFQGEKVLPLCNLIISTVLVVPLDDIISILCSQFRRIFEISYHSFFLEYQLVAFIDEDIWTIFCLFTSKNKFTARSLSYLHLSVLECGLLKLNEMKMKSQYWYIFNWWTNCRIFATIIGSKNKVFFYDFSMSEALCMFEW